MKDEELLKLSEAAAKYGSSLLDQLLYKQAACNSVPRLVRENTELKKANQFLHNQGGELDAALTTVANERDALKADIDRYVSINSDLATENASLRAKLEQAERAARDARDAALEEAAFFIERPLSYLDPHEVPTFAAEIRSLKTQPAQSGEGG